MVKLHARGRPAASPLDDAIANFALHGRTARPRPRPLPRIRPVEFFVIPFDQGRAAEHGRDRPEPYANAALDPVRRRLAV
jgi:hypothetical protein